MNRQIIIDENGIQCPYCGKTLIEDMSDYLIRHTSIKVEYEYEDRDTPYNMIMGNEWYIPIDNYNNKINYCSCCGAKLDWKRFYLKWEKYIEKNYREY